MQTLKIIFSCIIVLLLLSCSDYGSKISSLQWGKEMLELEFIFDDGLGLVLLQPKKRRIEYSGKLIAESIRYICVQTTLCQKKSIFVLSDASLYGDPKFNRCRFNSQLKQSKYCTGQKKSWLALYNQGSDQIITYPYVYHMRRVWPLITKLGRVRSTHQ